MRSDPSPRIQVLAGRIWLDEDTTPSALRPKRTDVVARAANLAPDDAFVQWMAADTGSYAGSQCGPTQWPETEVANLVRIEPDNGVAWMYAVAIAQAKGDRAATDDALAHMASARRADDHYADELAAWRTALARYPSQAADDTDPSTMDTATPEQATLRDALVTTGYRYSSADSEIESACKPNAATDGTWRRLGWCVDAGLLLATKGNSIVVRKSGLKMLSATGATKDDLADLQRQIDWLNANSAHPTQNGEAFIDKPANLAADWDGARSEIEATEHRLARLGKPLEAPTGWQDRGGETAEAANAAMDAWQTYMKDLLADLRASKDPREQALALVANHALTGDEEADTHPSSATTDALGALAAAHPDDIIVQWITATAAGMESTAAAAARANLDRIDSDNAATWMLSLDSTSSTDTAQALEHMAKASRFDDHSPQFYALWIAALRAHPLPDDVAGMMSSLPPGATDTAIGMAVYVTAVGMVASLSMPAWSQMSRTCKDIAAGQDLPARQACLQSARVMTDSSTSVAAAMTGVSILRTMDALDDDARQRQRTLVWWAQSTKDFVTDGDAMSRYFDDLLATGSEVEALRLAATRAGKVEPPADWTSPYEPKAAAPKASAAATAQDE